MRSCRGRGRVRAAVGSWDWVRDQSCPCFSHGYTGSDEGCANIIARVKIMIRVWVIMIRKNIRGSLRVSGRPGASQGLGNAHVRGQEDSPRHDRGQGRGHMVAVEGSASSVKDGVRCM